MNDKQRHRAQATFDRATDIVKIKELQQEVERLKAELQVKDACAQSFVKEAADALIKVEDLEKKISELKRLGDASITDIEQALDEARKEGRQSCSDLIEAYRKDGIRNGTLAGLEMAAGICEKSPEGDACYACDCHGEVPQEYYPTMIRAKAKELEGK